MNEIELIELHESSPGPDVQVSLVHGELGECKKVNERKQMNGKVTSLSERNKTDYLSVGRRGNAQLEIRVRNVFLPASREESLIDLQSI